MRNCLAMPLTLPEIPFPVKNAECLDLTPQNSECLDLTPQNSFGCRHASIIHSSSQATQFAQFELALLPPQIQGQISSSVPVAVYKLSPFLSFETLNGSDDSFPARSPRDSPQGWLFPRIARKNLPHLAQKLSPSQDDLPL